MDRPPSPLFRQVAIEAAAGTQIAASLTTNWRGVSAFTAVAFALLAALIAFVAVVEYAPVRRVAAFVDPQGRIKLLLAASEVASVRPGVDFRLAFRTYPQERFGVFAAKIDSVNEIPARPDEVPPAAATSEPTFIASASLAAALHGPNGEILPLAPGMLAEALVRMQRRTVLEWLLDPVLRGRNDKVVTPPGAPEIRR
jgi:hypothetical protein